MRLRLHAYMAVMIMTGWGGLRAENPPATQASTTPLRPSAEKTLDKGWILADWSGAQAPRRCNEMFPLSDQENQGVWRRFEPFWDEFSSAKLDAAKWLDHNPGWIGREPIYFDPQRVALSQGHLVLTGGARHVDTLHPLPEGFTHTSGYVKSQALMLYGYVEMRAKIQDASMQSCFWLYDGNAQHWTEIDILENAGAVERFERALATNLHVFRTLSYQGTPKRHPSSPASCKVPFRLADDWHVYGLEWDRESLAWYVDGVMVRKTPNQEHHFPLKLNLNLEANQAFVKDPMETRLPADYQIDYVRAWQHGPAVH